MKEKTLAIIMARGGSKGIPRKNIKPVAGKPLLAWTAIEALAATRVDRTIITTDSPQIADVARQYGVEVPFMRPAKLSQDDTPGIDPIIHATRWLEKNKNYKPDYIIALCPTTPLRESQDIDAAIELLIAQQADAVVSLVPAQQHPYWMKVLSPDGRMRDFIPLENPITRRQELPPVYTYNGAIYLAQRDVLLEQKTWYTEKTYAYVMPVERSLDINSSWDLYLADLILREKKDLKGYA